MPAPMDLDDDLALPAADALALRRRFPTLPPPAGGPSTDAMRQIPLASADRDGEAWALAAAVADHLGLL